MAYHPWRDARGRQSLDIVFVEHLPPGVRGRTCGDRIELASQLVSSAERRCTLAHELVHHERGSVPVDPVLLAREESLVERTAARRLVSLNHLLDVLCWTRHADEIAEELWIDVSMLHALVESLSSTERLWLEAELARRAA